MNINSQKQSFIVYIALILLTLAVFWQVNQYEFINYDDHVYVTANDHVQSGFTLNGLHWAFSTMHAEFWHPITWLSLMLDYHLYGLNAGGYHLTNLILHILSTLFLFWLFNRMTGAIWQSAFVAVVFALHPLHVEPVAWVAKRKDVLSGFFWMLTLCFYIYYTEKPVIKRYLSVLFFFLLALMSKPMVVTLPVIMILLDYWPLRRFESKRGNLFLWQLKEKTLFFILSIIFTVITFFAQYKPHAESFSLGFRIARAFVSFVTYLEKIFWPQNLAVYYPFSNQLPVWPAIASILLIIVISASVIAAFKRLPYLFVGWSWYAITILPIIGIFQSHAKAISDHYTYLPSIGISIMLAWGIPFLFSRKGIFKKILFPASIAVIIIMTVLTWQQCGHWKNSFTILGHALHVTKDNAVAHYLIALKLVKKEKIDEAMYHYNEAIRIIPDFDKVYFNKGDLYAKLGKYQIAIENYNTAIRFNPYYAEAYNSRGCAYADTGQYIKAIENFNEAIRLKKDFADAYYNRGLTYTKLHQYQFAVEDFNESIRLKPNHKDAYSNRGVIYLKHGYLELGCQDAGKACDLGNCELLEAANNKGICR